MNSFFTSTCSFTASSSSSSSSLDSTDSSACWSSNSYSSYSPRVREYFTVEFKLTAPCNLALISFSMRSLTASDLISGRSCTLIAYWPEGVIDEITEVCAMFSSLIRSTKSLHGTRDRSTVFFSVMTALVVSSESWALIGWFRDESLWIFPWPCTLTMMSHKPLHPLLTGIDFRSAISWMLSYSY